MASSETKYPLSCSRLAVGYNGGAVLDNINIELRRGSMAVLVGTNGSGKSTLLRTLAGIQKPLAGSVFFSGLDISGLSIGELADLRAVVSTVRQGGGAMTVEETVGVGRLRRTGCFGRMADTDKEIVSQSLAAVNMTHMASRRLATLSDGEKQKVMIARALAQNTPLIILDEPTAFLDVAARIEVLDLLRHLADDGKTILLSTHDIAPTLERSDTVVAVNPSAKSVTYGSLRDMIDSGALEASFAAKNIHFNPTLLDFR
ncbi:MAG: ABC transporter ATP-binding protein [Muribaculaceae bacterium]|nr:ABC transporter ATP-binding protein [Muribaculaceae bacterium]